MNIAYVLQYEDSFTRGGLKIDVVDSGTGASDHAEIRTSGDYVCRNFGLGANDESIVVLLKKRRYFIHTTPSTNLYYNSKIDAFLFFSLFLSVCDFRQHYIKFILL